MTHGQKYLLAHLTVLLVVFPIWLCGTDNAQAATNLVSSNSAGMVGNNESRISATSADGRYVAFESIASNLSNTFLDPPNTNNTWVVYIKYTVTGNIRLVSTSSSKSLGNNASTNHSISADWRYVAFRSNADNLVTG